MSAFDWFFVNLLLFSYITLIPPGWLGGFTKLSASLACDVITKFFNILLNSPIN